MSDPAPIIPVILSGGTGVRLWPLSRLGRPKQLVSLGGKESLLRQTAARVAEDALFAAPVIVAGEEDAEAVEAEVAGGRAPSLLILEPCPRGTAAAVALAALDAAGEDLLLVLPSDHVIGDPAAFRSAVEAARPFAAEGWLVTFGIRPDRPETGYGYIRRGGRLADGLFEAAGFVEKPPRDMAEAFLADGGYDWNAGIFLFRAGAMAEALAAHAPDLLAAVRAALAGGRRDGRQLRPDAAAFAAAPAASIDRAVMEKAARVAVAPVEMGWSDVGSWDAVHALGPRDADGNLLAGDVVAPDSRNCLIRSDGPVVVALGVEDLIVVATERAVLVVRRGESQRVGEALDALEARRHKPSG
ncbi:MAG: mannose-phosphate guanylyltransferase [Sphingomonadales bacterium]|jgi:mannose-1-phosphate guanylyltransferase/mannose-1-phosphate guanylyltransferase/mannose-6-phosphate isomerase|nr:mannose-phosphate guanylyltransferase [Sphingomonadales bacterium]